MATEFYVVWLDYKGQKISEEFTVKENEEKALLSVCTRLRQSRHLCPKEAAGFYIANAARLDALREKALEEYDRAFENVPLILGSSED